MTSNAKHFQKIFIWLLILSCFVAGFIFDGARHLEGRITALENCPVLMGHVHPETNKGFTGEARAVK